MRTITWRWGLVGESVSRPACVCIERPLVALIVLPTERLRDKLINSDIFCAPSVPVPGTISTKKQELPRRAATTFRARVYRDTFKHPVRSQQVTPLPEPRHPFLPLLPTLPPTCSIAVCHTTVPPPGNCIALPAFSLAPPPPRDAE